MIKQKKEQPVGGMDGLYPSEIKKLPTNKVKKVPAKVTPKTPTKPQPATAKTVKSPKKIFNAGGNFTKMKKKMYGMK